jgi:hypothetical protein
MTGSSAVVVVTASVVVVVWMDVGAVIVSVIEVVPDEAAVSVEAVV